VPSSPTTPSKVPGFSFLKGKLPPSAIDIVTGTTGADIHYRRMKLSNGSTVIVQVNGASMDNVPKGARFVKSWGTSHAAEPLSVVAGRPPGLGASSSSLLGESYSTLIGDSQSLILDGERESMYKQYGEASRMMPGSTGRPTTTTTSSSSAAVISVHTSNRRAQNLDFPTPKPVLYESPKRVNKMKSLLGFNALNDIAPDAGIGLPPKLADTFAVDNPALRPVSVRSRQRGGGDVLGLKRPPAMMHRLLQEEDSLIQKSKDLLSVSIDSSH
jgi:hypothetical protein